jgi:hypothetical protein
LSEVEAYLDVAMMYAVVICLSLLALGVLVPGLVPR